MAGAVGRDDGVPVPRVVAQAEVLEVSSDGRGRSCVPRPRGVRTTRMRRTSGATRMFSRTAWSRDRARTSGGAGAVSSYRIGKPRRDVACAVDAGADDLRCRTVRPGSTAPQDSREARQSIGAGEAPPHRAVYQPRRSGLRAGFPVSTSGPVESYGAAERDGCARIAGVVGARSCFTWRSRRPDLRGSAWCSTATPDMASVAGERHLDRAPIPPVAIRWAARSLRCRGGRRLVDHDGLGASPP